MVLEGSEEGFGVQVGVPYAPVSIVGIGKIDEEGVAFVEKGDRLRIYLVVRA